MRLCSESFQFGVGGWMLEFLVTAAVCTDCFQLSQVGMYTSGSAYANWAFEAD